MLPPPASDAKAPTCTSEPPSSGGCIDPGASNQLSAFSDRSPRAEKIFRPSGRSFAAADGPKLSHEVLQGGILRSLQEQIKTRRGELLVLGSHGRSAFSQALLGSLAAWLAVTRLMDAVRWTFMPGLVLATAAAGTLAVILFGLAGMRRMLGQRPWQVLRNE